MDNALPKSEAKITEAPLTGMGTDTVLSIPMPLLLLLIVKILYQFPYQFLMSK